MNFITTQIYQITSSAISPRYILNLSKYKMPEKCTVKFSHQKKHPLYGGGCFNDIDGGPMVIARNTKGDYTWYPITYEMGQEYLTPEHFAKTEVLFPKKKAELMKLIQEMKEEDNPIIVLYKLK